MKALSIKQPWASLIVEGIKDIENRNWRTNYRGRIYVHASKVQVHGRLDLLTKGQQRSLRKTAYNLIKHGIFTRSAIIGEVDIVDCVINDSSVWAEQMQFDVCPDTGLHILRKGQKYVWNWVLANPVKYDQPILNVKGALSFWKFNNEAGL